jgi:hypothetical protein
MKNSMKKKIIYFNRGLGKNLVFGDSTGLQIYSKRKGTSS